MVAIKRYPKNKERFIRLKRFAKQILNICEKLSITPVVWGGLAYFGYTKDKHYIIHDIDFLVPDKSIKKVMKFLEEKKIRHKYISDWHSLVISKGNLRVDLDPIEWYYKGPKRFKEFDFDGLTVKVVSLGQLIRMYKRASEVSQDKPEQHREKLEELRKK